MHYRLILIMCVMYFLTLLPSHASTETATSVELKPWSEYSLEERFILRKRWTVEKVQEIVDSLTAGGILPVEILPESAVRFYIEISELRFNKFF